MLISYHQLESFLRAAAYAGRYAASLCGEISFEGEPP
jgi:hypothetical protein